MAAPYMWIGLWDPDRGDDQLLADCAMSLEGSGARVSRETTEDGRSIVVFSHYPALCPPGEELSVAAPREAGGSGGLVEIVVPVDYFDEHPKLKPPKAWGRLRTALGRLLADVRPMLMVCPVEFAVDYFPDPPPDTAEALFAAGWVDPARLDERRRVAFDRALQDGPRSDVAGGWWWAADPERDPLRRRAADPEALARAVYAAWTGRHGATRVPEAELALPEVPAETTEIWFWAADRDEERLATEVATWAEAEGRSAEKVGLGPNGAPGWFPVVFEVEPGAGPSQGVELLRRAAAAVAPSWAAILPGSGIAVPGLAPDIPSTGVLPNIWVSHGWLGPDAYALLVHRLGGAHREEFGGGTLLVTDPAVLPDGDFADWCFDPAARWDRLVDAAAVLGERARATRGED